MIIAIASEISDLIDLSNLLDILSFPDEVLFFSLFIIDRTSRSLIWEKVKRWSVGYVNNL